MNLSLSPELLPDLQKYGVPAYIHGGNIPAKVRQHNGCIARLARQWK
jgi:hypothetical protein